MKYLTCYSMLGALLIVFLLSAVSFASDSPERLSAPDFDLKDINGTSHTLSQYRGHAVILNFWASWCAECLEEMPSLESLYNGFREHGLVVLGISIDREIASVRKVLNMIRVSYPVLMETSGQVFIHSYTVTKLPTTIFIDKDGYIVRTISGGVHFTSKKLKSFVEGMVSGEVP